MADVKIKALQCKECGHQFPAKATHVCEFCFGPLEVVYDYDAIKARVSRASIEKGPRSLWRYWDFLPVETHDPITIQEGYTPFWHAKHLGERLGLKNLYIKNDSVNPTFSFKDRVVSTALTRARELGFDTVACASTGNLAGATGAYAAHAKLKSFVFIPADLEPSKVVGAAIYGPTIVGINGNYDQVNKLCAEIADMFKWAFVNVNVRPYYAEGSKTLGFEVAEQLGWRAPDHCVVPMASGSLLTKIYKGLQEFTKVGLIAEHKTRMSGAQAEGCAPVVNAFKEKSDIIKPVKPNTIAKSLAIGNPADGFYALDIIQKTGGAAESVTDPQIVDGIFLLASTEGVYTETAGGVTIATLKKLAESGKIRPDEVTVAYITGNGYKTQEVIAEKVKKPLVIEPSIDQFREIYEQLSKETSHGHQSSHSSPVTQAH